MVQVKIATRAGVPVADVQKRSGALVGDRIAGIPKLLGGFVTGSISVF